MINKHTLDIKLIDFGSTFPLSDTPATIFYGTQKFSAPEALCGKPYVLEEQEVWALGTLLYVLIFKMDPFSDDDEIMDLNIGKRIRRLLNKNGEDGLRKYEVSDKAVEALCLMLSKDPVGRPKVSELLSLDFFTGN
jgi:serine/threonine protein kinase